MSTSVYSTSTSTSLTTSFSTIYQTSSTSTEASTITSVSTSLASVIVSSIYITPSTTVIIPPTTTIPPSIVAVTSTIYETPASTGGTESPTAIVITSTVSIPASTVTPTYANSDATTTSSSSATPSALGVTGSKTGDSGGLASGAKIAIAVIIPIIVIAAAFLLGLFFWRKRKARKNEEEQRKAEMAEYGFNPNNDPNLTPVAAAAYTDGGSEAADDAGYRGWGTTSSARKPSTTLGSNSRPVAAMSDSGSQPGGYGYQHSPVGTGQGSDHYSADGLMNTHPEDGETIGVLGGAGAGVAGAAALSRNRSGNADIRRGPSNASSAYSNGRHSEVSSDIPDMPGPYYQEEVPYNIYNDAQPSHGPYGDGTYGGSTGQPVIKDLQARRNTRIERAPTFPQTQSGVATNF